MKKVSIVMPIYNSENCMDNSIKSIMAQTYSDFELILVDDGSTDSSPEKVDEWHNRYPDKIIAVHQENKGQGGARNEGVLKANGDYLFFCDSDDTVDADLLEVCVDKAEQCGAQVVVFEYKMLRSDGTLIKNVKSPFDFSLNDNLKNNPNYLLVQGMVWHMLISLPYYRKIGVTFPERRWYEDLVAVEKILVSADNIVYTDKPLYNYYLSDNSTMRNTNVERNREIFTAMDDIFNYFKNLNCFEKYKNELCYLTIDNVYITSSLRLLRMHSKSKLLGEFKDYLKTNFPDYKNNPYIIQMSKQYRLTFWLLEHNLSKAVILLTGIKDKLQNGKR